jgi:FAD/FMN-containing dehydrogenase
MTVEPEPQIIELRGPEALVMHHVYGTNGIVLELEVGLAPAHDWLEGVATFDDFDAALRFGADLGRAPGLVTKEVSFMAAPITDYFTKLGLPKGAMRWSSWPRSSAKRPSPRCWPSAAAR